MKREAGYQSRLPIRDSAALTLPHLQLQCIIGGLCLQKIKSVFPLSGKNAPPFYKKITATLPYLIDFFLDFGSKLHNPKKRTTSRWRQI
jgi:hypothetical protein